MPTTTPARITATTLAPPGLRLAEPRTFADGAMEFRPVAEGVRAHLGRAAALRIARKVAPSAVPDSAAIVTFAEFDAPVGPWLGNRTDVAGGTEARAVWVVVFPGVVGKRSTGVVIRKRAVDQPTTTSRRVVTDVLVVVDDLTGEVVVRSEYASADASG